MSDQKDFSQQQYEELTDIILQDPRVQAAGLRVTGHGGMINLSGTVQSYEARQIAEKLAWEYAGSNTVKNTIRVRNQGDGPINSEAETRIRELLSPDVDLDGEGIEVVYDDGIVSLKGTVDSAWKRQRISDLIRSVPEVIDFALLVAVVPNGSLRDLELATHILDDVGGEDRVDINTVVITVENGVVTLSGEVPSYETRSSLYETVVPVAGVEEVRDEIEVQTSF